MNETTSSPDPSFDPPKAEDGFHEPAADVKKRNLITGLIITAFIVAWVLFGLRKLLF